MARSEARITVDVWEPSSDFRHLTRAAQGTYFFLLSQPDLAHCGVLGLRERRWAQAAAGMTVDDLLADLKELEGAGKIVVDYLAEELLVRSFIRRDKVYRQPNVLASARDSLALVQSPCIRDAIRVELVRVADLEMPEQSRKVLAEMLAVIGEPLAHPPIGGSGNPSGNPSPASLGERGVVTTVGSVSPPPSPRSVPLPAGADAPAAAGQAAFDGMPHPPEPSIGAGDVVAAFCSGAKDAGLDVPSEKLRSRVGRDARKLLNEGKRPAVLRDAAYEMGGSAYNDLDVAYRRADVAARDKAQEESAGAGTALEQWPANRPRSPTTRAGFDRQSSTGEKRMQQALDVARQLDAQFGTGATP